MRIQAEKKINTEKKISRQEKHKSNEIPVEFSFYSSEARQVNLAGEFNNWDIHSIPLVKKNETEWKTTVNLYPGHYEYKYLVDGRWVEDIPGMEKVDNPLGTNNLVIYVRNDCLG